MTEKFFLNLRRNKKEESKLNIKKVGNITELSANIRLECLPYDFQRVLDSEYCAYADIPFTGEINGVLSRVQYNPFWSKPAFEKDLSKIPDNIQNILIRRKDKYTTVLPLCMDDYNAYIGPSEDKQTLRIKITKYYEGSKSLNGVFAIISEDSNPYDSIFAAYEYAVNNGYIKTQLRKKKELPQIYKGLGWCTWNAFYHNVTEQGIIEKLEEFKEKNIPIKWIMIDDGWSIISKDNSFKIMSFQEDKTKFPRGIKEFIKYIKKNYGINQVGVWHSLTGYWYGIEKNSKLYKEHKNNMIKTNSGYYIPGGSRIYDFFDAWHRYLKEQGVDFVKIDTQGNAVEFLKGQYDCVKNSIEIQMQADRSAAKNFGNNVINCMGMSNINVHNRPYTALMRSSDDFYPEKHGSFREHIEQNVYNSVFLGNLYYCDFDMWWTNNESAAESSMLRALSGGPIYISDRVGETNPKYLKSIIDSYGNIQIFDGVAVPTEDCLFGYDDVLKVQNNKNGNKFVYEFRFSS